MSWSASASSEDAAAVDGAAAEEQVQDHYHEFTDEELNQMLYEWDDESEPVHEYHFMKEEWLMEQPEQPQHAQSVQATERTSSVNNLRINAHDDGHRTIVVNNRNNEDNHSHMNNDDDDDEQARAALPPPPPNPVFLNLDTDEAVHVVEFYVPWCPHCQVFKSRYIDIARQVTRRLIGIPIVFHAVSCSLYPQLCRTYNIDGFPIVLGYRLGESIQDKGWELNEEGRTMTAESIAKELNLSLAHEPKTISTRVFTDSNDKREHEARINALSAAAVHEAKFRHEYQSTLNERYHNAAVSLAFVLKTSVFLRQDVQLDGPRTNALKDFLELIDWASPPQWEVRTGMVQSLLHRMNDIVTDETLMVGIVENHQSRRYPKHGLWGDVQVFLEEEKRIHVGHEKRDREPRIVSGIDKDEVLWANSQWTEACTHSERGLGYTCGLWDLFHILTIGASLPSHQLFGFHSGYLTGSQHVAQVIKRFIANFLACDVCRWNFVRSFDNCSHNHCLRLKPIMPSLLLRSSSTSKTEQTELVLWLWEVHNSVNERLMKESAQREDREVTEQELLAAAFPTKEMCPDCWLDDTMKKHDKDAVVAFLQSWYWPSTTSGETKSSAPFYPLVATSRNQTGTTNGILTLSFILVAIVMTLCGVMRALRTTTTSKTAPTRRRKDT